MAYGPQVDREEEEPDQATGQNICRAFTQL